MKSKILYIILSCMLISLSGCSRSNGGMEAPQSQESKPISIKASAKEQDGFSGDAEAGNSSKVSTTLFGKGSVTYEITSLAVGDIAGISGYETGADDTKCLLVGITVTNESVPMNSDGLRVLANVFNLATADAYSYKTAASENDLPQLSLEPIYFNIAENEYNTHSYFEYDFPNIGESIDFILGYKLTDDADELLKADELYLAYEYDEILVPLHYEQ